MPTAFHKSSVASGVRKLPEDLENHWKYDHEIFVTFSAHCEGLWFTKQNLERRVQKESLYFNYPITLHISNPAYKHICLYLGHKHMCLYPVDIYQSVTKSLRFKVTVIPLISSQINVAQVIFSLNYNFYLCDLSQIPNSKKTLLSRYKILSLHTFVLFGRLIIV